MQCVVLERPPQVKKALQRPEKLSAWFQPVNGSVQAVFSWQVSPESTGQTPITGFQLSWVKVSRSSTISQTHTLPPVSHTHVCLTNIRTQQHSKHTQCEPVPQDQRSLTVDALQPQSKYRLQVQVLSGAGHGPSVSKTIHTPHVNGTLL